MSVYFGTYSCYGTQEKLGRVRENNNEIKRHERIKVQKETPDTPLCIRNYPGIQRNVQKFAPKFN